MPLHPPFFPIGFIPYSPHIIHSKVQINTTLKAKRPKETHKNNPTILHYAINAFPMLERKKKSQWLFSGKHSSSKNNPEVQISTSLHSFTLTQTLRSWSREREKCFTVNYVHVQPRRLSCMCQWPRQLARSECTNKPLPSSFSQQSYQTRKFWGLAGIQANSLKWNIKGRASGKYITV